MLCFCTFFISFKYDFHVDVKREKCNDISASMVLKNNVWYDTFSVVKYGR